MAEIKILSEAELREAVTLDRDAVSCVEDCFRALATESIIMPPIMSLDIAEQNGEVDVKTAYVPGFDSFAIKMSLGFFDNPKLGLPSLNGLMVLFNAKTGQVEALLLDNGYLTDLRTAAAGAVAAKWLAREDARRVGVVGAGVQARLQVKALALVRDLAEVRVWARDAEKAANYAAEMTEDLQIPVSVSASIEAAAAESDILVTTTPSKSPLVFASALHSGLHITAMGSDAEYKNELDPPVLADCDLYACDRRSQCEILGELHHALAAGAVSAETVVPELGEIIAGRVPGRSGPDDVTVCDLTGAGVQDTAIATLAFQRSQDKGAGTVFTS